MSKELDLVYKAYHKNVNMTCSALKTWAKNPCAKKASLSSAPLRRNLRLLCKPKSAWTGSDVRDAKRTIAFNKRMKGVAKGRAAVKGCASKRDIALKNWAWDPS